MIKNNHMQPGQFLVNKDGEKQKIVEVLDNIIAIERDHSGIIKWMPKYKIDIWGWSLLEEPWVPKKGSSYYWLDSGNGLIKESIWINDVFDEERLKLSNVHRTEADAELYKQKLIETMGRKEK
jgi:hypothetical protein